MKRGNVEKAVDLKAATKDRNSFCDGRHWEPVRARVLSRSNWAEMREDQGSVSGVGAPWEFLILDSRPGRKANAAGGGERGLEVITRTK